MQRLENIDVPEPADICNFCYPSQERTILYEDERVYVMPTLGHFTNGYLLLISKEHVDCFGDIANADVRRAKEQVRDVLETVYGSCCFFEHGRTGGCFERGHKKVCYHAHIHCLPLSHDFTSDLKNDFPYRQIERWEDLRNVREEHPHYLYMEPHTGEKHAFLVENDSLESHYLRKKACEALSLPLKYANWREHPLKDRMEETVQQLKERFV